MNIHSYANHFILEVCNEIVKYVVLTGHLKAFPEGKKFFLLSRTFCLSIGRTTDLAGRYIKPMGCPVNP